MTFELLKIHNVTSQNLYSSDCNGRHAYIYLENTHFAKAELKYID